MTKRTDYFAGLLEAIEIIKIEKSVVEMQWEDFPDIMSCCLAALDNAILLIQDDIQQMQYEIQKMEENT